MKPDPIHGSPDNPQSWNRYPYVLNDPMSYIDPLGGIERPRNLVGCLPNYRNILADGVGFTFGCDWGEDDYPGCPPGFIAIFGGVRGQPTIRSVQQYAGEIFGSSKFERYGIGYELTPDGVNILIPRNIYQIMLANGFVAPVIAIPIGILGWEVAYIGVTGTATGSGP